MGQPGGPAPILVGVTASASGSSSSESRLAWPPNLRLPARHELGSFCECGRRATSLVVGGAFQAVLLVVAVGGWLLATWLMVSVIASVASFWPRFSWATITLAVAALVGFVGIPAKARSLQRRRAASGRPLYRDLLVLALLAVGFLIATFGAVGIVVASAY